MARLCLGAMLLSALMATGCSTCERAVKYQSVNFDGQGIKIPVQIGNSAIPIDIGSLKVHTEKLREVSEIIQVLDNDQYQSCKLIESLPKDQRAPLVMKIIEKNDAISKLSIILSSAPTSSAGQFDMALDKWIKATKNEP